MVKLVVLYGRPEDPDAFERYYADTHTALAKAVPGLRRCAALPPPMAPKSLTSASPNSHSTTWRPSKRASRRTRGRPQ
jgi:uncharacterized protein (TIGR02118 family)